MPPKRIYTIGHSTHEAGDFIALLQRHGVTALADVRSHPVSRLRHFCKENLERELVNAGIQYVFLGKQLGARRSEPECYVNGQASYERIAQLPAFQHGLDRLERGAQEHTVAMMCAEKEPLDCHRAILISRPLARRGWKIEHILADGALEDHADTMRRLLKRRDITITLFEPDLTEEELFERGYEEQANEIAYREDAEELVSRQIDVNTQRVITQYF